MSNATSPNSTSNCPLTTPLKTDFRIALYCCIVITSIVGNALVIFVVARNKRMQTVANFLICNLSVADLLITFFPMIWSIVQLKHYSKGNWPMGAFMCVFNYMANYLSVACSILTLTVISLDRFLAILFPLKQIITNRLLPFLIIGIWLTSFAFASPTIFTQALIKQGDQTYCMEIWKPPFDEINSPKHYTIILFVFLYAIPLAVMAVLYGAIAVKLWRRTIPGNGSTQADEQTIVQKKKVIKMLFCVVLIFAVCWFPVFLMQFLWFFDQFYIVCPYSFPEWFMFLAYFMQYLGSAANPFVYFAFSDAYRRGLVRGFRCHTRRATRSGTLSMSTFAHSEKPTARRSKKLQISPNIAVIPESHDNEGASI
eukprot:Seg49.5 transcript_id=Seg49.5/GoldUCD/mRNA.D3Y31 product="RYamide receptor" protein_id=Seg49.5/GoldUCD/D3Y31